MDMILKRSFDEADTFGSECRMYVLETRELRKTFGEGEALVEALRGVDMGVRQGQMLAIMCRSGS